ncbi:MAG: Flp pilus assembly protein CpaB [Anaerolineaceae bacterium]|nr:MAG: Flp pilus assembly protein CpaB [Anaerolineaceae bacterium]
MSRRTGMIIAVVGVVAVAAGVLLISTILRQSVSPLPQATPVPPRTEPVVVVTHDIPIRALLRAQDLTLVEVPVEFAPPNALNEISEALDRITKIPLVAGEIIMEHHLVDPTNIKDDLAFVIGDDQVLMAFPATDLMSQIDLLQPGDIVDILVSIEQPVLPGQAGTSGMFGEEAEEEDELFTFSALQRVEISAVVVEIKPARQTTSTTSRTESVGFTEAEATPQPTPTPHPSDIEPQAILLALSPQNALVLKHLKDAGGVIDIVIRAPTSEMLFELNPVMSEYLKDRYELVISR